MKTQKTIKTPQKAAIYIRVSTDAQREEGYSIDAQKDALTAYCKAKGIKDFDCYIDGGFTGSNIERPEMQRLIGDIKNGIINCVLVYKLDRLSRSQKDTLYLIEDVFNPYGVAFMSLGENMDTSTPHGRAMLGILSAFAQLERENIRERTRMGMKERVKTGLWMGGGRIPYGYNYDRTQGILVPNAEAENVRKMYDLYLEGNSFSKIAQTMGMKYDRQVMMILSRKSNAGYIIYNNEEYKGQHEAIITLDTYLRTMDMMRDRSVVRETSGNYLFTGLILCGKCGAKMRYQKWGKKKGDCKIICYSHDKNKPYLVKDPNCSNARQWAADVEDAVIKDLFSFSVKLNTVKEKKSSDLKVTEILNRQYDEISKKIKRLYNLYSEDSDDILIETINEHKKQLLDIQRQIEVEQERNEISDKIEKVKKSLTTLKETWEYMTLDERKNLIRGCVEKIVITADNIEVFYKFGSLSKGLTT
ncbi:MAG: recombinase family protein [Oscillospiraceae bacterium]|nr:recombinase family protein [Oscillospiraceae bacterium]